MVNQGAVWHPDIWNTKIIIIIIINYIKGICCWFHVDAKQIFLIGLDVRYGHFMLIGDCMKKLALCFWPGYLLYCLSLRILLYFMSLSSSFQQCTQLLCYWLLFCSGFECNYVCCECHGQLWHIQQTMEADADRLWVSLSHGLPHCQYAWTLSSWAVLQFAGRWSHMHSVLFGFYDHQNVLT